MTTVSQLTAAFDKLGRDAVDGVGAPRVFDRLCNLAVELSGSLGAGTMFENDEGDLVPVCGSHDWVGNLDAIQVQIGHGPCLDAYDSGQRLVVTLGDEGYGSFARHARQSGVLSVHSFPLRSGQHSVGALNIYRTETGPPDADGTTAVQTLADLATAYAMRLREVGHYSALAEQLQEALDSRVIIEQAKGKLSVQLALGVDESFAVMRRYARDHNLRLHRVADEVVAGVLDLTDEA